jgi:hypothetical protein
VIYHHKLGYPGVSRVKSSWNQKSKWIFSIYLSWAKEITHLLSENIMKWYIMG